MQKHRIAGKNPIEGNQKLLYNAEDEGKRCIRKDAAWRGEADA